jgi:hypothetical protein
MSRLLTDRIAFARRSGVLCGLFLVVTGTVAFGQTSGTPDRSPAPPSASDEPTPGTCKPIGLTLSGEAVFPLECWDFIEKQKAMSRPTPPPETGSVPATAGAKPVAPDDKPTGSTDKAPVVDERPALETEPGTRPAETNPAGAEAPEIQPSEGKSAAMGAAPSPGTRSDSPETEDVKPPTADASPPAADGKPAGEEKPSSGEDQPAGKQSADATADDGKPDTKRTERAASSSRRSENRAHERSAGVPGCTHFRTYNAASGTYRDYSGRTRRCR